ncbi:hypothetical protein BC834DRAFT_972223 [Gloeopeniophorella convolvens]|nr:hypothetical protein BC834DRAFT_972223 [Gloeopeniophorella convolvens]
MVPKATSDDRFSPRNVAELLGRHTELLANHFRIDKQHVENFINWRAACLPSDDLKSEHTQQQRKLSPASVAGTEDMDVDDYENTKPGPSAHLPTPAASISPEPKYRTIPLLDVEVSPRRPTLYSLASNPRLCGDPGAPVLRASPGADVVTSSRTQPQPAAPLLPTNAPSQDIARPSESASAQSAGSSALARPAAPSLASLLETGLSLPHTLHELDEAYAPTYAKIERFFKAVEEGRYARFGLTPELLESVER